MAREDELHISQALRPSDTPPEAARELASCWMAVTNSGGAVGFAFPPVTLDDVTPAADELVAGLDPGHRRLLLARDEMGLEQLRLAARGGESLEKFYACLGWKEVGRWPNGRRVHLGDRDEVLMLLAPL